jgi:hypothetical protein
MLAFKLAEISWIMGHWSFSWTDWRTQRLFKVLEGVVDRYRDAERLKTEKVIRLITEHSEREIVARTRR